jgi:hypothetical protein
MPHNLTVTIDDELWKRMKERPDIRWAAVMREAAKDRLNALDFFKKIVEKNKFSEEEIERISVEIGRKINKSAARKTK